MKEYFKLVTILKCDNFHLKVLINLLGNRFKFTPCLHSNDYLIFRDLLFSFENNFKDLNKKIFFEEKNYIYKSLNSSSLMSSSFDVSQNDLEVSNHSDSVDCFFNKIKKPLNPSCF